MTRELTAGALAETEAPVIRLAMFYEGEFLGGTINLWTGATSIDWNGKTWTAAGSLLSIGTISESVDLRAIGVAITLTGMSPEIIALVEQNARLGMSGKVWLGFLTAAGAIIADPYNSFTGRLDVPSWSTDGTSCNVTIAYENELIDLERARSYRWTHATQLAQHPDRLGFQYQSEQADKKLVF